jgi:tripartite-type tricarboxylate transporter receptor subunit TctC
MGKSMPQLRSAQIALLALTALTTAAQAQPQDYFRGKTVSIVVGFTPGGGYDLNARAVARHLSKHIPGNPNVVVQNMPGAGSLTSVRYLDATAPKDGTAITTFNPGLITQSIVEPDKVNLDFRNVAWVGSVSPDFRVCYGFGPNGVKTWAELMARKEFILGTTSKGAGSYINGAILRQVFNAPVRQIIGFPGSAEQRLATERGELDGDCGSFNSIPVNWVQERRVHPFVRFTEQRPQDIPESAVFVGTFAQTEEQRQLLDVLNAADGLGRPFVMSKQVPAERLAVIRKAFMDTTKDPAFIADMDKQKLPLFPLAGEAAEVTVDKMINVPPQIVAKAKAIYE